jgi:hypothetical protein
LNAFIDVFHMTTHDRRTPYHGYIWQAGRIIETTRQRSTAELAAWCQKYDLPVRAHEALLRQELRQLGIAAQVVVDGAREREMPLPLYPS